MIFVDSNVPMYLAGGAHPNKERALKTAERFLNEGRRMVTSAEVFQEILHRYGALGRREFIDPAFDALDGLVDEVFPITREDAVAAKQLMGELADLSSRDCLHAAVMRRNDVLEIFTFDRAFERIPGILRHP